jgi:serine/threonine-protein kinase
MPNGHKSSSELKIRQKLGKYRIERRLGAGGFAAVYQAMDTVQGIRVAIKVPHSQYTTDAVLTEFRKEIRTTAPLEHDNILPIKDASIIEDRLVVVFPLGDETLQQRMMRRICLETAFEITEQILRATALAHSHHVIHCDIKPENRLRDRESVAENGSRWRHRNSRLYGTGTSHGKAIIPVRCVFDRADCLAIAFRSMAGMAIRMAGCRLSKVAWSDSSRIH